MESDDFDDFLQRLDEYNVDYIYRPENVISLKFKMAEAGQQRWTRGRTIGLEYDEMNIRRRIENQKRN